MSDVRLSNASPTLERVDARQPDNVRPPVRRNLFGTPDPEEIRRYVTASIQEDVQAFTERYNYDPVDERPLTPRNYEWEEDGDAPEFYRRPPHRNQRPQQRDVDLSGDSSRQDAVERHGRQSDRQPDRSGSRKRNSEVLGPCSSECQSKRSPTDDDDDDDENKSDGAGSRAVKAEEERPSRPEDGVEVQ